MTSHHHHQYKYSHVIVVGALLCLFLMIGGKNAVTHEEDDNSHRVLTLIDDRVTLDPLFPLHAKDYWGFFLAILGLVVAAGGGIGGGGILVPIYILIMKFPIKYAISLSGVTVLGGAVANNLVNHSKSHPDDEKRNTAQPKRPSVDWDLLLQLEPPAMAGTVVGAALNAVLPSIVLIVLLLALLVFTAYKTLTKAMQLYDKETKRIQEQQRASSQHDQPDETKSMLAKDTTYGALSVPQGATEPEPQCNNELRNEVWKAIFKMTVLFAIITVLSLLEGRSEGRENSGNFFGLPQCDTRCHGYSQLSMLVIIVGFGFWTRTSILHRVRVLGGPILSDIDWDDSNTIHYPMYAILAGIVAGLFGIGGGMVKGPLMLELNVHPTVASATTAAMILFTSATATIRYCMYGFVQYDYGVVCFAIGFISTMFGQSIMSFLMKVHDRPSYIAFSIGIVVAVSAVCMTVESISAIRSG